MSYHRANEAAPMSSAASVTVCTNDVALGYLVEDALPASLPEALSDAELLVPEMVELKHDGVCLTAVGARMIAEIGHDVGGPLGNNSLPSTVRGIDISLSVRGIVLLLVSRTTRPTVVVALTASLPPPGEILKRLLGFASPAPLHDPSLQIRTDVPRRHRDLPERMQSVLLASAVSGKMRDNHGEWRSLVAHSAGGRAVAGSNPVSPILTRWPRKRARCPMWPSDKGTRVILVLRLVPESTGVGAAGRVGLLVESLGRSLKVAAPSSSKCAIRPPRVFPSGEGLVSRPSNGLLPDHVVYPHHQVLRHHLRHRGDGRRKSCPGCSRDDCSDSRRLGHEGREAPYSPTPSRIDLGSLGLRLRPR